MELLSKYISNLSFKIRLYFVRCIGKFIHLILIYFTNKTYTTINISTYPSFKCAFFYPSNYEPDTNYSIYINFHGGGFISGNPEDDAEFCNFLAKKSNCIVISSEYRLSPEYPFPIPINDCLNIIKWVKQKYNPPKIAIGGFSAGGTLALSVMQKIKNEKEEDIVIDSVISFYPVVDFSTNSKNTFTEKDPKKRNVYHEAYLMNINNNIESLTNPLLSPLYISSELFPDSIVIIAAEDDPNIVDIINLIKKIEKDKNKNIGKIYENVFHGWTHVPENLIGKDKIEKKWDSFNMVVKEINKVFNKKDN